MKHPASCYATDNLRVLMLLLVAISKKAFLSFKTTWFLHFLLFKDFIDLFSERGGGRKWGRETPCARETSTGCLLHALDRGPDWQPRHGPWPEIEQMTFYLREDTQPTESRQSGFLHFLIVWENLCSFSYLWIEHYCIFTQTYAKKYYMTLLNGNVIINS